MDRFRAGNGPGSVQKQSVQKTLVFNNNQATFPEMISI